MALNGEDHGAVALLEPGLTQRVLGERAMRPDHDLHEPGILRDEVDGALGTTSRRVQALAPGQGQ